MIHIKPFNFKRSLARTLFPVATPRTHLRNRLRSSRSIVEVLIRLVTLFSPFGPIFDVANVVRGLRVKERSRLLYFHRLILLTYLLLVVDTELDAFSLPRHRLRRILEEMQGLPLVF